MRGVTLVAVLCCLAAASYAESDVDFGSGSGDDDGGVETISPTNSTKTSTDSTNDDGSGEDDEDGDGSGSAMSSTAETPTTEMETTTEQQSTTEQQTTTERVETTTETATTAAAIQGDDEDEVSGSGSGSTTSQPQDEPTTTSSDIYLSTTTEQTLIIPGRSSTTESTPKSSTPKSSTPKSSTPTIRFKTTQKSTSTVDNRVTTQPTDPMTIYITQPKATRRIPTRKPEVISYTRKATTKMDAKTKEPKMKISEEPTEQYDEEITTDRNDIGTTTKEGDPNVAALKKDKDGFTLTTEVIAGVVGCALLALLLIAFLMYRLKKRDEGSYLLDESNAYPVDYKKMNVSDKEAFI
jgi:hypothetical protein